jgi:hypothetical protein
MEDASPYRLEWDATGSILHVTLTGFWTAEIFASFETDV